MSDPRPSLRNSGPDPADPAAVYLAEVREAVRQCDELVARMQVASVSAVEFNAAQDRLAEPAPRLLAAVEAVLKRHHPVEYTGIRCATCYRADGGKAFWPCGEYEAISRALLGERE